MADADAVIADLLGGAYDDHLVELGEALNTRQRSGDVELSWRVEFGELTIDQTNKFGHGVTVGAAYKMMEIGPSPRNLEPMSSELHRVHIVAAHLMDRDNLTFADALKQMRESSLDDIRVSEYVERDLPKGHSTPETS